MQRLFMYVFSCLCSRVYSLSGRHLEEIALRKRHITSQDGHQLSRM